MRQVYRSTFLLVISLLGFGPAASHTSTPMATPGGGKSAEQAYHNIQVLKGIPADQLIPAMQFVTYSLGVECNYCDVEGAFERDDKKPKQIARKMIQMMGEINRDNFQGKQFVTYYSCHRGSERPLTTPTIPEAGSNPTVSSIPGGPFSVPADVPSAEQTISKYIDAVGGAPALEKVSTREQKGMMVMGGHDVALQILTKVGDKQLTIIHLPHGESIIAFNGSSGWSAAPHRPLFDIPSVEIVSAQVETDLQWPLHLKELFSELKSSPPQAVSGRQTFVVLGLNSGNLGAQFYFDQRSGLLLRILRYTNSPLGNNPTQIDYADYRVQNGIKLPFQQIV